MPHGPTFFPSKGACIYCGSNDDTLSDEHIVPLAIGGQHVIRNASCKTCAAITSKFERKIARDLWGDARISFDAPSRRKAQRPRIIMMPDSEKPGRSIPIPANEYPAGFVFYEMAEPGVLLGLDENVDTSGKWKLVMVDDDKRRDEFQRKYGSKPVMKFTHVPADFGRLIAKVGYGQILTVLDPGDFTPICLPYIMGEKSNISYVVGGSREKAVPTPEFGYHLNAMSYVLPGRMLIVATVRLYANTHAPGYHVGVGEVFGNENIDRVLKKMGASLAGGLQP